MQRKQSKAGQSEQTRGALLDVAHRLFAERGYAGTGTEEIVRQSGVTRGALYYHYRDKQALFRAVVERLQRMILARIEAGAGTASDPWAGFVAGMHGLLDACMERDVQRIVLVEAPAVLGWAVWRELDGKYGFGLLQGALQGLMDAGIVEPQPVPPLAHMLLGALSEAGLVLAEAENIAEARASVGLALNCLLRGLRAHP